MAKIKVNGCNVRIPHGQMPLQPDPSDPEGASAYGYETEESTAVLLVSALEPKDAMPFHSRQLVIDSIHGYLGEKQGLISVQDGRTAAGRDYVCSVVKSAKEPSGVQYTLTMQLDYGGWVLNLTGFFEEKGETGTREAVTLEQLRSRGRFTEDLKGWAMDPYDAAFKKGLLMNISEMEHLDEKFPGHPLSVLRRFIAYVAEHN